MLTAFQQVEDNLAAIRVLSNEARQQHEATASAEQSLDLFQTRYEGGVDTYLQVVTWQTAALNNQRNDLYIFERRLDASVLLVKALGGGWDTTKLPRLTMLVPGRSHVVRSGVSQISHPPKAINDRDA